VSDAKHEDKEASAEAAGPPGPSKLPMILALVNTVAILAAMGALVYTKLLFKRPVITESGQRAALAKTNASPLPQAEPGFVTFEPTTVNLASEEPGRHRYATIGFSIGIRDKSRAAEVEAVRPLIMDKVLSLFGRRQPQELTNVQGRYVLRAELVDAANEILRENHGKIQLEKPAPGKEGKGEGEGAPKEGGEGGGEGGEGGEGEHGKAKPKEGPHAPIVGDLISDVFFTQFMVQ
jgi:flagellar basal body-associated protein FliL